jgi:hypothetical protein
MEKIPRTFYERVMRASIGVGLLGALFATVYGAAGEALVYLIFLGWMLVNFALWRPFLLEMLKLRRRVGVLWPLGFLKAIWFVVLFVLGYYYIGEAGDRKTANFLAFLLGFNTPFLVALLKAGGQSLTRTRGAESAQGGPDLLAEPEKGHQPTEE